MLETFQNLYLGSGQECLHEDLLRVFGELRSIYETAAEAPPTARPEDIRRDI